MKCRISIVLAAILLSSCSSIISRLTSLQAGSGGIKKEAVYSGIYPGLRFSADFFFQPEVISKDFGKIVPAARAPIVLLVGIPFGRFRHLPSSLLLRLLPVLERLELLCPRVEAQNLPAQKNDAYAHVGRRPGAPSHSALVRGPRAGCRRDPGAEHPVER